MTTIIRAMTVEDYDQLHALWMRIKGFGIRSIDVFTMYVWIRHTAVTESERAWLPTQCRL